ncbi:MAG: RNA-guided endonuclease InsQ/TnpB family protein [Candidatus Wukongarchaeota archaeon]|nr:transposase [Candidatus Wukongarchaeota archaeon]
MNRGVYKVSKGKKYKMQLTQKTRIFPSEEQEEVLQDLSEKCRLIYNFALAGRIEAWKKNGKNVNYTKQQNDLPEIKRKYPEYSWVYSKVLQMVLRRLDGDYKSFLALRRNGDKKANPPRFKGKNHFTTMNYNQSGFKLDKEGWVEFSHNHPKTTPLRFTIPEKFDFTDKKVKQVTIFKEDGDTFYISIVYERKEKPYLDNGLYQAIDLGITNIITAVNTKGKFLQTKNPRPDKYWQSKIEEIQPKRDHCKKGSRKWKRYHRKLRKMQRKCANQIKDFQHKLSKKLVENTKANTIIIGDLNVKKMSNSNRNKDKKRDKSLHRAVQNNGCLSRFARFLTYKAKLVGKRVIEISEENTTKTCCACGKKHEMNIWDRAMRCDYCGNELDRDKNSAVNIMVRFLSQNAPVDGLSSFEDILRKTGIPIRMYSQEAPLQKRGVVHC